MGWYLLVVNLAIIFAIPLLGDNPRSWPDRHAG